MKFSVSWASEWRQIENYSLKADCIEYKKWKKFTKKVAPSRDYLHSLIAMLDYELCRINTRNKTEIRHLFPKSIPLLPSVIACSRAKTPTDTRHQHMIDLMRFINLNRTCFYKICKRFDKRFKTTIYRKWLREKTNQPFVFNILGGFWVRRLEIELKGNRVEACPICFDENPTTSIMLSCGHTFCKSCLLSFHEINGRRGTFLNIVSYKKCVEGKSFSCPMCRSNHPYLDFDEYHVIPHNHSHSFLHSIDH